MKKTTFILLFLTLFTALQARSQTFPSQKGAKYTTEQNIILQDASDVLIIQDSKIETTSDLTFKNATVILMNTTIQCKDATFDNATVKNIIIVGTVTINCNSLTFPVSKIPLNGLGENPAFLINHKSAAPPVNFPNSISANMSIAITRKP